MSVCDRKYVEKEYLEYHGYDSFIDFLTNETNKSLYQVSVNDFIKLNIEYQKKTGWDRFIGLSELINFVGGVDYIKETAKNEFGYNIAFIENEANVIGYVLDATLAINKVVYTNLKS